MNQNLLSQKIKNSRGFVTLIFIVGFAQLSGCGGGSSGPVRNPAVETSPVTDDGSGSVTPTPTAGPVASATPVVTVTPTATPASTPGNGTSLGNLKVNIVKQINLAPSQAQKLAQAVTVLNQVLGTTQFQNEIVNFTYQGARQFVQNNGLTNEQVYQALMEGAEKYPTQTVANGLADIQIATYFPPWYSVTSAVAFTSQSDPVLHLYNSYFNSASVAEIAKTVIHEWTHKLGFEHDYNSTSKRPYSVPYGVGGVIEKQVELYLGQ